MPPQSEKTKAGRPLLRHFTGAGPKQGRVRPQRARSPRTGQKRAAPQCTKVGAGASTVTEPSAKREEQERANPAAPQSPEARAGDTVQAPRKLGRGGAYYTTNPKKQKGRRWPLFSHSQTPETGLVRGADRRWCASTGNPAAHHGPELRAGAVRVSARLGQLRQRVSRKPQRLEVRATRPQRAAADNTHDRRRAISAARP